MIEEHILSDEEILKAVCEKNPDGWNLLYSRFNPMIRSITGWQKWNFSEHEQQDVSQNTYVQLQKALPSFQQRCSLACFIKKITIHQCINEIRRQVRCRAVMISSVQQSPDGDWNEIEFGTAGAPNPHDEIIRSEQQQALRRALNQLKETCEKAITLFYVKNLSYREIADHLGISTNTVGSRLAKCLDKLHKTLRQRPSFERTPS